MDILEQIKLALLDSYLSNYADYIVKLLESLKKDTVYVNEMYCYYSNEWTRHFSIRDIKCFTDKLRNQLGTDIFARLRWGFPCDDLITEYFRSDIIFDSNWNLLCFKNMVYDKTQRIFRKQAREDYILRSLSYDYDSEPKYIAQVNEIIDATFPDIDVKNYVMKSIAGSLFDCNNPIKYLFLNKNDYSGFVFMRLIQYAFSGYYDNYDHNFPFLTNVRCAIQHGYEWVYTKEHKQKIFLFGKSFEIHKCELQSNIRVIKLKKNYIKKYSTSFYQNCASSVMFLLLQYYDLYEREGIVELDSVARYTEKFRRKQIYTQINKKEIEWFK